MFNSAQARENQERYCTDKRSAHRVAFGAQHESALHSAARDHTEVAVRVLKICTQRPQPVCSKRVSTCGDDVQSNRGRTDQRDVGFRAVQFGEARDRVVAELLASGRGG